MALWMAWLCGWHGFVDGIAYVTVAFGGSVSV